MKDSSVVEHSRGSFSKDNAASPQRREASPASSPQPRSSNPIVESLRIEPHVQLIHRSSSGRNLRLKHSKPSAVHSPHGLTPRAPDRRRPQETPTPRRQQPSAVSPREETEHAHKNNASPSTHPDRSNNQEGSVVKPQRVAKREDRRSSFMIPENILEQMGYVRASSSTPSPAPNQEHAVLEEKVAVSLAQIEEEANVPRIHNQHEQQQDERDGNGRGVYLFALWRHVRRNPTLGDAITGYDSAPSPTRASPPRPSPPKRRSISDDQTPSPRRPEHSMYTAARSLASSTSRHGFGRQHHTVDIVRDSSTDASRTELSITRSTSPIIGGSSRSGVRAILGTLASPDDEDRAIVRWRLGDLIGEGTFGKVYQALNTDTGELFAIKEIEVRTAATEDQVRQLQKLSEEIELMHNLRHNHIVRYKGSHRADKHFYIFMEYVSGGSIASILKRYGAFDEDLIGQYTRQIVKGVVYLHEMGIVHRDIKGANVLISEGGVAKLADFGCSKQLPDIITTSLEESLRSIRGSIPWMAPEVVRQTGHGFKADIWSIGATAIEMATAKHPWPSVTNGLAAMYQIATAKSSPPIPELLSAEARSFLARCFCIDPKERASAAELMQHSFLRKREKRDA